MSTTSEKVTFFLEDDPQGLSTSDNNLALAKYLMSSGVSHAIEKIERYEDAPRTGWDVTYKT